MRRDDERRWILKSLEVSGGSRWRWLAQWWFAVARSGGGRRDVRPAARTDGTELFSGELKGSTSEQPLGIQPARRAR